MLVVLEGPDRCGKTTLFNLMRGRLKNFLFLDALPLPKELMPVMSFVEQRQEAVWKQLYNNRQNYLCDRHFAVSSLVYDEFYKREHLIDSMHWAGQMTVVYLQVPVEELVRRCKDAPDAFMDPSRYEELLAVYDRVLKEFRCVYFDGMQTPEALASQLTDYLRSML